MQISIGEAIPSGRIWHSCIKGSDHKWERVPSGRKYIIARFQVESVGDKVSDCI